MTTPASRTRFATTARTALKRHPERGSYDRALVTAVIDEALLCHVAFVAGGIVRVLPTAHARVGEMLYLHGARGNQMLRAVCDGEAAVSFTLLDGLVFARTALHHSMNFRSVMLIARGCEVIEREEKVAALTALVDHAAPGRMREVGLPSDDELRSTLMIRLPIDEASAKVRSGPPLDAETDLQRPVWAGELPLRLMAAPIAHAPDLMAQVELSPAVASAARAWSGRLA